MSDSANWNLKRVEGAGAGEEFNGTPLHKPEVGEPFHFAHDNQKVLRTSPVTRVTEKTERTIIQTENSLYSLEYKGNKK